MTSIFETLRRIQRLPRPHRIAFLRGLLQHTPPRSQRYTELYVALRSEINGQLKKENRMVHRATAPASAPIGHPAEEFAL